MQFHQLNNPKDTALAEDARFFSLCPDAFVGTKTSPPVRKYLNNYQKASDNTHHCRSPAQAQSQTNPKPDYRV